MREYQNMTPSLKIPCFRYEEAFYKNVIKVKNEVLFNRNEMKKGLDQYL